MRQAKSIGKQASVVILLLVLSGCLSIEVIDDVNNPGIYFREARREINRIRSCGRRQKNPEQMSILVFDKHERKIVKITAPVWLVDGCSNVEHWINRGKDEFNLKIRYHFDRRKFRNLRHRRAGLLTEINDRGNRVLVWLE